MKKDSFMLDRYATEEVLHSTMMDQMLTATIDKKKSAIKVFSAKLRRLNEQPSGRKVQAG